MLFMEILGSALVLGAIASVAQARYRLSFVCNLFAAFTWSWVAVSASLWGMLGLQAAIAVIALFGLWRMR